MNIKENSALQAKINSIRNHKYVSEILEVSPIELLYNQSPMIASIHQGDYPENIKFTPMQKVCVTYRNTNPSIGIVTETIYAGFDAVRYSYCMNGMSKAERLAENLIGVEFVGEYAYTK